MALMALTTFALASTNRPALLAGEGWGPTPPQLLELRTAAPNALPIVTAHGMVCSQSLTPDSPLHVDFFGRSCVYSASALLLERGVDREIAASTLE